MSMQATDGNRRLDIDLTLDGRTRKYRLNGKAKRPIDLKGLIPSVVFTPDDLDLVKGPNSGRRSSLDTLGAQVNKSYYTVRRDYEKVIRHKNRLLKEEADDGEEPPRDGAAFARRHPVMMGWVKGIVSAIAGFVVAVVLCRIFLG